MTNIEFAYSVDLNWDNTTLASGKLSIQAGLQFDFATPYKGFINVGVYAYKKWQNDGVAPTFPFQLIQIRAETSASIRHGPSISITRSRLAPCRSNTSSSR